MTDLHEELEQEFLDIQDRLGDQDLLSDQVEYAKVAKRYSELENIVKCIRDIRSSNEDIETAKEMLTEADGRIVVLLWVQEPDFICRIRIE